MNCSNIKYSRLLVTRQDRSTFWAIYVFLTLFFILASSPVVIGFYDKIGTDDIREILSDHPVLFRVGFACVGFFPFVLTTSVIVLCLGKKGRSCVGVELGVRFLMLIELFGIFCSIVGLFLFVL